jgi:outer membrane receptor protein involved in Fe transport
MSTKLNWGRILLSGASFAAMGAAASTALAQDEAQVSEEIVVTATGRTAAIQDVPLAVTAVGGETIQNTGANDLRDVTQVAPSLQMGSGQSNSSGTIARIRGIGTGSDNPGFEAAVGIFVDGVYRARAGAALADLPDLERVEVLRGPQGTLFGRNTSAGAISVITAGPEFDPGIYLETTAGLDDLEEVGARGGVNVPISDTMAFRFDGSVRAREGYITDLISGDDINDRDRGSLRGQMLWDLTDDATLRVIVDASETNEVCCGITPLVYGTSQLVIAGLNNAIFGTPGSPGLTVPGVVLPVEDRNMTVTPAMPGLPAMGPGLPAQPGHGPRSYEEETEEWGISGQLDWEFGGVTLTSITAYRDWSADRDQDIDFNLIDIAYRDGLTVAFENFTQEFRLQGETGRINWLVGLFYGNEALDTTDTIRIGSMSNLYVNTIVQANSGGCELFDTTPADSDLVADPAPSFFFCASGFNPALANAYLGGNVAGQGQQADNWRVDTESISLFTHNEISLSDQLVLTLGVRYNSENKDLDANLVSEANSCDSLQLIEFFTGIVSTIENASAGGAQLMNLACNPAINPISNGNWSGDREEEEWSGTVSLAYHMTDDVMLYGGYSRGYKAGGFNVDRSGFAVRPSTIDPTTLSVDQLAFEPEFTDAYELGVKSTILGGTTTLNAALFYQQIHDYQLNAFNGFNFITRNVPEAISQGAELELSARPTENLTLTGGVVYTDAYYDSTVVFNAQDPLPNTVTAGQPFTFAPEWTVTGGILYEQPIGADMRALFYLDARWQDEYRTQTLSRDPLGRTDNEAYAILNGRIGFGPNNDRWSVEVWGRNLTDETYFVGAFVPPLQNSFVVFPNEPATYGVTLRARY